MNNLFKAIIRKWKSKYQCNLATGRNMPTWSKITAENGPCARSSHQLSALGSKVFLFGGENGPYDSHFGYGLAVPNTKVYCLDLCEPHSWTEVKHSGDAPSARLAHGQTIVEGYLYVFGGRQPGEGGDLEGIRSLNDLHRLHLATGVWEEVVDASGDIPSVRSYHQMVSVGQTIYLFAGMVNDARYNDLYAFDTVSKHWEKLPPAPMEGRGGPGLCVIGEGQSASLVVVAGFSGRPMSDVWQYKIATREWTRREDWTLPVARSIFACGVLTSDPLGDCTTICTFGGELENFDAALIQEGKDPTVQASLYSNETLLLHSTKDGHGIRVVDAADSADCPAARGWTAGCTAAVDGVSCFVVFGGIREGNKGEPSGVRLGDIWIMK